MGGLNPADTPPTHTHTSVTPRFPCHPPCRAKRLPASRPAGAGAGAMGRRKERYPRRAQAMKRRKAARASSSSCARRPRAASASLSSSSSDASSPGPLYTAKAKRGGKIRVGDAGDCGVSHPGPPLTLIQLLGEAVQRGQQHLAGPAGQGAGGQQLAFLAPGGDRGTRAVGGPPASLQAAPSWWNPPATAKNWGSLTGRWCWCPGRRR